MKINENTSVPLIWFAGLLGAVVTILVPIVIAGTIKVFTVDVRLKRIEDKIGIVEPISLAPSVVPDAHADTI